MSSDPPNDAPSTPPEAGAGTPRAAPPSGDEELELAAATRARGAELLEVLEHHARDEREHAEATSTYAFVCAVATGYGRGRAELIREAAKLHAVGKLYVPAQILSAAREELSPADRERLDSHHEAGAALARGAGVDETICAWILGVRERFDGSGPGALERTAGQSHS